jgi:hypothetical protein
MTGHSARRIGPLALALSLLLSLAPTAGATTAPSVRLVRTARQVHLDRIQGVVHLDLGVFVAPVGGDFAIRARKDAWDGPIRAVQVDAGGSPVRTIPESLVTGWGGLDGFLEVTVTRPSGLRVTRRHYAFCPNSGERQRLNDEGPLTPSYPAHPCRSTFPFTRGMVWGIDEHWAASATSYDENQPLRLREGTYEITVRIADAYAALLAVPDAGRTVSLSATVKDVDWGEPVPEPGVGAMGAELAETPAPPKVPTLTQAPGETLPDLAALPAWSLQTHSEAGRDYLAFASTPWNAGPAPFVIEGFRRADDDVMDAYQYFYDRDGTVRGRASIGEMGFHAGGGHDHWHFLQFAQFDLLETGGGRVLRGLKQGFCIAPTDPVDLTVAGAAMMGWVHGQGSHCGGEKSLWVREVLAPGWGDTYHNVSGQAFDISRVPNGEYVVRVHVDPLETIHQTTRDNDVALRTVTLGGRRHRRTVTVAPWNGIEDNPPPLPGPMPLLAAQRQTPTR